MSSPDTQVTESPAVVAAEAELDAILKSVNKEPAASPEKTDENYPPEGEGDKKPDEPEKPVQYEQKRPAGYDAIDLDTATKEQIQERLNYLYGQAKGNKEEKVSLEKQLKAIIDHNKQLEQGLNELYERDARRTQTDDLSQYESALQATLAGIQEAKDFGDTKREAELFSHYAALKQWKNDYDLAAQQPKQQPRQQQQQRQAQPEVPYSPDEASYIVGLTKEEDDTGKPLRPWLIKGDPNFEKAIDLAKKITKDFEDKGIKPSIYQIMPRLEKYMNAKQPTQQSAVLGGDGGNLTTPPKNKTMGLSNEQKTVTRKLGIDIRKMGVDTEAQMARLSKLKSVRLEDI